MGKRGLSPGEVFEAVRAERFGGFPFPDRKAFLMANTKPQAPAACPQCAEDHLINADSLSGAAWARVCPRCGWLGSASMPKASGAGPSRWSRRAEGESGFDMAGSPACALVGRSIGAHRAEVFR